MGILANENAISSGNYQIANSLRCQSASSQYLNRTWGTPTNAQKFTCSFWIKRGALSSYQQLFGGGTIASNAGGLQLTSSDTLNFYWENGTNCNLTTNAVYRDPSAWYHILVVQDTTQATASNRVLIYVNGVLQTLTGTYPALNATATFNSATVPFVLMAGRTTAPALFVDGYIAECYWVDGQALTSSSFGTTDPSSGQWVAIKYTGTYGLQGFYLPFSNGTSTTTLGADSSGNSNNWTLTNFTRSAGVSDCWMTDVPSGNSGASGTQPSANYAVMNPLWQGRTNSPTNANLTYAASSVGIATMDVSGGSFYWEITSTGGTTTAAVYSTLASSSIGVTTGLTYGFRFNGSTGAFDYTTNGSSFTSIATGLTSGPYFPYLSTAAGTTANFNSGIRSFAYTPPTGFKALCTANLPASTILQGNKYMDATLYTGTGATLSVTNAGSFKPDFVWMKSRSAATDHALFDSVRGTTLELISDSTAAETTQATGLTAFNANGWTIGAEAKLNTNAATYVGWQWQAGQGSTSSNTNGSITSTTSVNATAGFSVVTYTGTGANATVGHGLGVAPKMIIVKSRSSAQSWPVGHSSLTSWAYNLALDLTAAQGNNPTVWNSTTPTSSVFSLGTNVVSNQSTITYVAYCFAAIQGFSKDFSFTGNGSADGVFTYLGFSPKLILLKRTDTTGNWIMWDTVRNTYNVLGAELYPNLANAEATATDLDVLSNGFKIRNTTAAFNASGGAYIGFAWATNPFQNSNAF